MNLQKPTTPTPAWVRILRRTGAAIITMSLLGLLMTKLPIFNPPGVPVPPKGHPYFGVQLDWGNDSVSEYSGRLGHTPAIFGRYVKYPMDETDLKDINNSVSQVAGSHAMLMLT